MKFNESSNFIRWPRCIVMFDITGSFSTEERSESVHTEAHGVWRSNLVYAHSRHGTDNTFAKAYIHYISIRWSKYIISVQVSSALMIMTFKSNKISIDRLTHLKRITIKWRKHELWVWSAVNRVAWCRHYRLVWRLVQIGLYSSLTRSLTSVESKSLPAIWIRRSTKQGDSCDCYHCNWQ